MRAYLVRRLVGLVFVMLGISMFAFAMVYILPGDPARVIAGPRASAEVLKSMREEWGLNEPVAVQYVNYMRRLLSGDLGRSFYFKEEVFPALVRRLPATALLAASGLAVALLVGVPAGVISAVRHHSWVDRSVMLASLTGITLPAFLQGLLLLYFFAFLLPLFPIGGYGEISHLILPAVTLGIHTSSWYARVLRSTMLDILGQDYIRTARAKGLREFMVIARHGLRNALGPIVSMVGADMGYYLGGVLVVEKVFGWPGLGSQAWTAVTFRDLPMIMGTVLAGALCMVVANLVVDIIQTIVDPRIQVH